MYENSIELEIFDLNWNFYIFIIQWILLLNKEYNFFIWWIIDQMEHECQLYFLKSFEWC